MRGRARTACDAQRQRAAAFVTPYCAANSTVAATRASTTVTSTRRMPDPSTAPIATVTIQSKLFICDVARFPTIRTATTAKT